ncbi:MAG: hypothetical protein FD176_323 [Rhodospirillaceae bacterium]|nr:MAG: hypothetical protein FD176_323 [Rhodospirillaceae bacterium]TNC97428.1 MAG: transaldolase [Stygiobacter sp.]
MTGTSAPSPKVRIFADGADLDGVRALAANPVICGFTTNPTLMRKAGISDYQAFARDMLAIVGERSVSFEVFADDFAEIERQARIIAGWGSNVYVKIPITNTKGESAAPTIRRLSDAGVKLNVTAILTVAQVRRTVEALNAEVPAIISVFAGRIADTGRDPVPVMAQCRQEMASRPKAELLWASTRELYNIFQAEVSGCDIITATPDILGKLGGVGRDLDELSLDTVKMFYRDALSAGYQL